MQTVFFRNLFLVGVVGVLGIGSSLYFYHWYTNPISDFHYERDAQEVLEQYKREWYWLFAPGSELEPADIDQLLKDRIIARRGRTQEPATIKVARENGHVAGFVVYYQQRQERGHIQFLEVDKRYRGKGYGRKLMRAAIEDLIARGVLYIYMATRLSNKEARTLYESLGFEKRSDDSVNIEYILYPKNYRQ